MSSLPPGYIKGLDGIVRVELELLAQEQARNSDPKMTARDALLAAAEDILAELICCHVFERDKGTERAGEEHAICFWSGAARAIVLEHAERLRDKTVPLPEGLCGNRDDHEPHQHEGGSLGTFMCHADQGRRLPYAAERRRGKESTC